MAKSEISRTIAGHLTPIILICRLAISMSVVEGKGVKTYRAIEDFDLLLGAREAAEKDGGGIRVPPELWQQ